jgi:hypothetical protein
LQGFSEKAYGFFAISNQPSATVWSADIGGAGRSVADFGASLRYRFVPQLSPFMILLMADH